MSIDVSLLSKICKAPGAPGYERVIRQLIHKEISELADKVTMDAMGNVVAKIKGKSSEKKIMAAAHMDEIGFMVNYIDDDGFIHFNPLGGFDPKTLTSQRVIIHGKKDIIGVMGCKPIHIMSAEEKGKVVKLEDYFIDTGLSKKELLKIVEVGNPITRERDLIEMGECVSGKSLDNRISVYLLIETLKKLKSEKLLPCYDFYAVFTVQEEVGLRGASVSTLDIQPDFGIGLDVTIACDVPGTPKKNHITKLGGGVAIKIMDASTICDYRMVDFMKKTAEIESITWQPEVLTAGGTDTAGLQRMSAGGSISGAISIPVRYIHQVTEMANKHDIAEGIKLLTATLLNLSEHDWSLLK
ncbi:M42 family metallopeptidase [Akkermansiaceae bacterium]|nr:M42 family metallopeptidase [Akkermansiaceae bacterium]